MRIKNFFHSISRKDWLFIGIIGISILALAFVSINSKPDIPIEIRMIPPDSLRAYLLNAQDRQTLVELEELRGKDQPDSLYTWVRNHYWPVQFIGLRLLEQATLFCSRGRIQLATAQLDTARELGQVLAEVVQDSFLLRQVESIANLDDKALHKRARACEAYANAYEKLYSGKTGEARKEFERASKLAERAGDDKLQIDAMVWLQWFFVNANKHQLIIKIGKKISEKAEHVGYWRRLAQAHQQAAEAYRELDKDQLALATVEKSIRIAKLIDDKTTLLNSYHGQAQIFYRMENYREAERVLKKLTEIDTEGEYTGKINLLQGKIYFERGEYGRAQPLYEKAVEYFQEFGPKLLEAISLSHLSRLQLRNGKYRNALLLEKKSFEIRETEKNEDRMAFSFSNLGLIYSKMDSLEKATDCYRKAIQLQPPGGKRHATDTWLRLGEVQIKKGNLRAADEAYRMAKNLANSINYQLGKAQALIGHGHIAVKTGQLDNAKSSFSSALNIANELKIPRLETAALFGLSQVEKESNNFDRAVQYIQQAITAIENLRMAIYRDSLRVSFFATTQELFEEAILLSLARGKNEMALHFSERARARALRDALGTPSLRELQGDRL
jgi:tetratricopeptide (TPR) repeat protein